MRNARLILFLLLVFALASSPTIVRADTPHCTFHADGSITCTMGGGGDDDGGGSNPTPPPGACTPGATMWVQRFIPDGSGTCSMYTALIDTCTGGVLDLGDDLDQGVPCPEAPEPQPHHPCTTLIVSSGGVTCKAGNTWHVEATVHFPETYLDVRPFPATLVRWPTAIRNGGTPSASGSGEQAYYGSGSSGHPNVGDWSDITLTLSLNPAGPMAVALPRIGSLLLADRGASGAPQIIHWEVPSHPEAGAGPLARAVSGMDELPGDLPLFVGAGRSPYRLSWQLSYFQYEAITDCVDGPDSSGDYNCGGGSGHKQVVGHEWRKHSSGGEIPPSEVANLPASLSADLNNDGTPDAYWDRNLTLRRMDDANRVDNPTYRRSWNWGGAIYWGVREGQGQIGWPGN
jgi:hypothetical protein